MRWQGETDEQRRERQRGPTRRFAVVPIQMSDGTWVWLEHFWEGEEIGIWARNPVCRALTREDLEQLIAAPTTPPPPKR